METRLIEKKVTDDDKAFDSSLRPATLKEYIGQDRVKENLKIFIQAAKSRYESLDHCLFWGPPGLGKTTLAYIISRELGVNLKSTSGPAIEKQGDLVAILTNLKDKDVFFIDEIHRLNRSIEETLYPAMEDFQVDIVIGQGPSARSMKLKLPKFTLIGATTRTGLLTSPLRGRFGIKHRLDYYHIDDLNKILSRSAKLLNIDVSKEGAMEIALRSRGTPRVSNRLLRRVRDYAQVKGDGFIDKKIASKGLEMLDIDEKGLDNLDRKLLQMIIDRFDGGPVGINTISALVSEEKDTIEDVYEPYLIQEGFIEKTPKGRVVTKYAYTHLGSKLPLDKQKKLF